MDVRALSSGGVWNCFQNKRSIGKSVISIEMVLCCPRDIFTVAQPDTRGTIAGKLRSLSGFDLWFALERGEANSDAGFLRGLGEVGRMGKEQRFKCP